MVKLAVADTSSLFNFKGEAKETDNKEDLKKALEKNELNVDPNKNLEDAVVDAYLLHFLKDMDEKTIMSSRLIKNLLTKTSNEPQRIGEMGKLESMRQVMKGQQKFDVNEASDKVNTTLGNSVKEHILKTKKKMLLNEIKDNDDKEINSEEFQKKINEISSEDITNYDGIVDIKYLKYANDGGNDENSGFNPDHNEVANNEDDAEIINGDFQYESEDDEDYKNGENRNLNMNNNDFATISERPEEEFDENESKQNQERKKEINNAFNNSKNQNNKKNNPNGNDNTKRNSKNGEEEKNYKLFEYDLQDNDMQFRTHKIPKLKKSNSLGQSLWLSSIIYIPEKNIIATGGYDDFKVKIWRFNKKTFSMNKIAEYKGHKGHITMLIYVPSREYLLVGSQDCSFSVLSLEKIKQVSSKEEKKDVLLEESAGSVAEIENSAYGSLVKGEIKELFVGKKKFWNRCMLYKIGKKDILVTCFMKKLFTTELDSFSSKERVKVFEPITNILELKKNHYLIAMTEHMVIYDLRNKVKIGKNYKEHRIIKNYNLIELEYVRERKMLISAGCDGLVVLWRVCEKKEFDSKILEAQEDEVPQIFLMKIQKVRFHSDKLCRIFSVVFMRFENKVILCNEGNRLYVFSFEKRAPKNGMLNSVEILNAKYIIKNLENPISGIYNFEDFGHIITYHWKQKSIHFLKLED